MKPVWWWIILHQPAFQLLVVAALTVGLFAIAGIVWAAS